MKSHTLLRRSIKLAVFGLLSSLAIAGVAVRGSAARLAASAEPRAIVHWDDQGHLIRPTGYRNWIYVGTPLTPNELNPPEAPFPEFHNVYIDPESFEHYSATGTFRDGTVIIKELVSVGSKAAVSGQGYFMGEFIGLEAAVRDAERFPDEPGHWAYFSFGHSYPLADTAEAFPAAACSSCHEASAEDDGVFTQYYPVLRAAKGPQQPTRGTTSLPSSAAMHSDEQSFDQRADTMLHASESAMQPAVDTGRVDALVPTDTEELHRFLTSGGYRDFPNKESGVHPSRGPHAKFNWPVRVFLGPKIDASMKAGNSSHPAGSSLVKEMYSADGSALIGWAVMVKTQQDSDNGSGWFWYETTNTEDANDFVAAGNGVPLCVGCHSLGKDYVVTGYPLK